MKEYFSIGETAKINNVSIQALRYYDKLGLLKPAYVDEETNYRYYTIDQFVYLDIIKYCKDIGAHLKELKAVLHSKDIIKMLSFIEKQEKVVEKEITRLKNISIAIGNIKDKIQYSLQLKKINKIYFRELKKRITMDTILNEKYKKRDVEIKLRQMDKFVEDNELIFEGETGYFVNLDFFLKDNKICYDSIYSTICGKDIEEKEINFKVIPAGKFICISYFSNEREVCACKLKNYLKENNIPTIKLVLEIELFNTMEPGSKDSLYELQILI
ncbi:helix-turn-helix domain-containing protein [Haloimpatiens sp. FM7330]|uniref:MerR family transcriptional regulator n=1 Tax=Haloimpatiens sp. FM7330 TaxID=3298610 RepID=UPI00362CED35